MKTHASSCSFIFALGENSNLASLYSFSQLRAEDESRSSSIKMCAAVHVRLYHLSARLIKLDSLFAVVVNAAAWSEEIIFLHALLTLFLFSPSTRPQFLFVWLFFFPSFFFFSQTASLSLILPPRFIFIVVIRNLSLVSHAGCRLYASSPYLTYPLSSMCHRPPFTSRACKFHNVTCMACEHLSKEHLRDVWHKWQGLTIHTT